MNIEISFSVYMGIVVLGPTWKNVNLYFKESLLDYSNMFWEKHV